VLHGLAGTVSTFTEAVVFTSFIVGIIRNHHDGTLSSLHLGGRLIYKSKYDRTAGLITLQLKWLFLKEMSEYKSLCILYKLMKFNQVEVYNDLFPRNLVFFIDTRIVQGMICTRNSTQELYLDIRLFMSDRLNFGMLFPRM